MKAIHLVHAPENYPWFETFSKEADSYLASLLRDGEDPETLLEYRDTLEAGAPLRVDSFTGPDDAVETFDSGGEHTNLVPTTTNDGFAEFVAEFDRTHPRQAAAKARDPASLEFPRDG